VLVRICRLGMWKRLKIKLLYKNELLHQLNGA
jgi:hypothetical protein